MLTLGHTSARPASIGALARNQTSAFAGEPQVRYLMPLATSAVFYVWVSVAFLVCRVRHNETGTASLMLLAYGYPDWKQRRRTLWVILVLLTGLLGVTAVAALVPLLSPLVVVGGLSVVALSGLTHYRLWKCRSAMRRLRAARPQEPYWLVSSMASVQSGEGAKLLREVAAEADREGWTLVLEAANSGLVDYYARFGFAVAAEGEPMPWSELRPEGPVPCLVTCMVREPLRGTDPRGQA
jgi:hypothetical protein